MQFWVQILFVGTNLIGVNKSTNNGLTWTNSNSGIPINAIRSLLVSGSNIFAGTSGSGVFRSTNNGSNWTPAYNGLTNFYIGILYNSGHIFSQILLQDYSKQLIMEQSG